MAVELDELKLTVTLDDQASQQLGRLQQQLQGIVTAIAPAQAGLRQVGQSLRGLGGHAHSAHTSLSALAARGGLIGGFFFEIGRQVQHMAKEFAEAVADLKAYADSMVALDQVSSRAAQTMGQFRANVAVFRESGVSESEATKMLSGYANALAELQKPGLSRLQADLLRGLQGVHRERMENLIEIVATSSQTQGINAIKVAGEQIAEEQRRRGRPELAAAAQAAFYARWNMPGLEKVRGMLREISTTEERMMAARRVDAERYQTAIEKQGDARRRTIEGLQSIAFQILPINRGAEATAGFFKGIADVVDKIDRSMRNTNSAADKQRSEAARSKVVTPEGKEITAQEGLSEDEKRRLQRRYNPRRQTTTRPGETLPPELSDVGDVGDVKDVTGGASRPPPSKPAERPVYRGRRQLHLLGGEVTGGVGNQVLGGGATGPGGTVDVLALGIPSIGDLLKPDPNAIVAPFNPDDYAGTGWRGLPKSKRVIDLTGQPSELAFVQEQSERLSLLTGEVNKLNEFLQPELMKMLLAGTGRPAHHNKPRGGAVGESNPEKPPVGMEQPGGGSPSEAVDPFATPTRDDVTALEFAKQHLGMHEIANKAKLEKFFKDNNYPLAASAAWCAVYANSVLQATGHETSAPINAPKVSGAAAGSFLQNPDYKPATFEDVESGYGTYVGILKGESPRTHIEGVHVGILTGESRYNPKTGKLEYRMRGGNQPVSDANSGERASGEGRVVSDIWYEADKLHLRKAPSSQAELRTLGIDPSSGSIAGLGEQPQYTGPEEGAGKGKRLDVADASQLGAAVEGSFDVAKYDASKAERASGAAQDWLGEAYSRRGQKAEEQLSSISGGEGSDILIGAGGEPMQAAAKRRPPSTEPVGPGALTDATSDDPRRYQRAVENLTEDQEWQARTERALKQAGPGFSETESAQPGEGYGGGAGLVPPGYIQREIERGQGREEDWPSISFQMAPRGGVPGLPFDPMTGRPAGQPISLRGSSLDQQPDGSTLDRTANDIQVNQNGRLTVDVKAPAGTSVSAEGSGVFNQTETNRTIPMENTAELRPAEL